MCSFSDEVLSDINYHTFDLIKYFSLQSMVQLLYCVQQQLECVIRAWSSTIPFLAKILY